MGRGGKGSGGEERVVGRGRGRKGQWEGRKG